MPSRRDFLVQSSAAVLASSMLSASQQHAKQGILKLRLRTSRPAEMQRFYAQTLQLPVQPDAGDRFTVRAGSSEIEFTPAEGDPYYHFAFNIPENKLQAAKRFLASRSVEILKRPGGDGRDEYHFESWNAHAIYFLDPAGNIVEFIARHNLKNAAEGEFGPADILYASEIGLVVDDVRRAAAAAGDAGLKQFVGPPTDTFAAVGDDHRLLIIVNKGRAWNIGGNRAASVFSTGAVLAGPTAAGVPFGDLPYDVAIAAS